jgi:hypothetical protein
MNINVCFHENSLEDPTPPYILFFQGLEVEEMETMKDVLNESLV